jgi:hypothetical protein
MAEGCWELFHFCIGSYTHRWATIAALPEPIAGIGFCLPRLADLRKLSADFWSRVAYLYQARNETLKYPMFGAGLSIGVTWFFTPVQGDFVLTAAGATSGGIK